MSASPLIPEARARVNDLPVDPRAPALSLFDRGFAYGDGVFEVLRTYNRRPFGLEDHLARMNRSAAALGIPMGAPNARWIAQVDEVLRECPWPESTVRLTLTRGIAPPGVAPLRTGPPTRIVMAYALPTIPAIADAGVTVITVRGPRALRSGVSQGHKTLEYLTSVMALREAQGAGAQDAIFLTGEGAVIEGASANVFVISGGVVRTTGDEVHALPGVTLRVVLEAARAEGYRTERTRLTETDLWTADEVFLTSSVRELVPVLQIDEHTVGDGRVGEGTRRIHARFRALVGAP